MAGSIKWFIYTTDDGDDFAVKLDESNTEQINAGTQDYVAGAGVNYALPRNVKPRNLVYESTDGAVRRRLVALTPTIFNGVAAGNSYTDPVSGVVVNLVQKNGERISLPRADDTGLQDGDPS